MNILTALWLGSGKINVHNLYKVIVTQSRNPDFYNVFNVPDTVTGRYEVIMLHAYFVMKRLREIGPDASATAQALFDCMFLDMDKNLREMGVGDLSVGKKIKDMATAFYGRIKAYDEGLEADRERLANSLRRNMYAHSKPTDRQLSAMTELLSNQVRESSSWTLDQIKNGTITFVSPRDYD